MLQEPSLGGKAYWTLADFLDADVWDDLGGRAGLKEKKKMIILHKGTEEHRTAGTSAPQGEPGVPPSVLTPQSPCTATRAVGVGTLYRDTIYAATAMDKCNHALLHVAGWGVITPVELEARPGSGALLLSIEPMLERQSACKRQIKGNH